MGGPFEALRAAPEAVTRAEALLVQVDRCLSLGLGRLGPEQLASLDSLGRVFSQTPLGAPVQAALQGLRRSEFIEKHFAALAAARSGLQGSMHDALAAQAAQALGRAPVEGAPAPEPEVQALAPHQVTYSESARQWLVELALAGFSRLGPEALFPFAATLEKLQGEPRLVRQAALLTGFYQELVAALPIDALPSLPLYRWADLWSRALLLCLKPPQPAKEEKVTGELRVIGAVLRHHANFVTVTSHGVLHEKGAPPRWVRASLSSYKVDALSGIEVWKLFQRTAPNLLKAIGEKASLALKNMPLSSAHDLAWDDDQASAGAPFDALAEARSFAAGASAPGRASLDGVDRHPVQLAEPFFVENFSVTTDAGTQSTLLTHEGAALPVLLGRMSPASEWSSKELGAAVSLCGLLRYDSGAWGIEPLFAAGKGKKDLFFTGREGVAQALKGKSDSLAVLQERASRLLRAKS